MICTPEELSVWAVYGKMSPLGLYSKETVVVYDTVDQEVILAFLAGVHKFALTRNYAKEIIVIYPSVYLETPLALLGVVRKLVVASHCLMKIIEMYPLRD